MKIEHIFVFKESREGESRVALTPQAVTQLKEKNIPIMVESNAGLLSGFSDAEYIQAGASIFNLNTEKLPTNSLILRVKRPTKSRAKLEDSLISRNSLMMGFLDPFDVDNESHLEKWRSLGITPISLELLNIPADDERNAQSAMSRFAGKLALQDAVKRYKGSHPKRVSVFGTGPAGKSAALSAKAMHLPTQVFGRQEKYRKIFEDNGITYFVLPIKHQKKFIQNHLKNETYYYYCSAGCRTKITVIN